MRFIEGFHSKDYFNIGCSIFSDSNSEFFKEIIGRQPDRYVKPLKYIEKEQRVFNNNKRAGYKSPRVVDKALEITCKYFNLVYN